MVKILDLHQEQEATVRLAQGASDDPQSHGRGFRGPARPIKGRLHLTAGELAYTMRSENILIGRAGHCRVVIDDSLVSREHALLSVSPIGATVEDLDSANGTWVNDSRIFGPQVLGDGDRIRVGSQVLRVSAIAVTDATPPEHSTTRTQPGPMAGRDVPTERPDVLSVLARVAARKLADGDPLGAEAALCDHLGKVLVTASLGLAVSPSICGAASRQALLLALGLGEPRWVDYVLKLHIRARLALAPQVANLLEEGLAAVQGVDHALLEEYLELVDHSELSGEERRLLGRLRGLKS